jgi:shikimate 5-dehydrogenase
MTGKSFTRTGAEMVNQVLATRSSDREAGDVSWNYWAGAVGSACALALDMRGAAREVVLVDRTRERARAVATDMRYEGY